MFSLLLLTRVGCFWQVWSTWTTRTFGKTEQSVQHLLIKPCNVCSHLRELMVELASVEFPAQEESQESLVQRDWMEREASPEIMDKMVSMGQRGPKEQGCVCVCVCMTCISCVCSHITTWFLPQGVSGEPGTPGRDGYDGEKVRIISACVCVCVHVLEQRVKHHIHSV